MWDVFKNNEYIMQNELNHLNAIAFDLSNNEFFLKSRRNARYFVLLNII